MVRGEGWGNICGKTPIIQDRRAGRCLRVDGSGSKDGPVSESDTGINVRDPSKGMNTRKNKLRGLFGHCDERGPYCGRRMKRLEHDGWKKEKDLVRC